MSGSLRVCFPTEKFLKFLKIKKIKFFEYKTSIHSIRVPNYNMNLFKGIIGLTAKFKNKLI